MPGREPPAPRGVKTSASTRVVATPYALRRPPGTHTPQPGSVAAQRIVAASPTGTTPLSTSAQRSPMPPEATPACRCCAACLKASQEVLHAYSVLLLNSKRLFIDDALHHYSGDDAWIRVLRSLGWSDESASASATRNKWIVAKV
ncbi:hypothetical protein JKF63_05151 [Porcisia hertigi]|uniref:Uncharacterized protein n=1 Tax=Porcisia hertigi TaxID=2761500 RepID=A0A836IJH4_9TRYP|nr:hypothetical protein JKF63_05151 [Porcisia hertigi]